LLVGGATLLSGVSSGKMTHNNPVNDLVPVNNFVVEAVWDDDAEVWVAESDGVPG
jgi:uncharacterized protein DUF1902